MDPMTTFTNIFKSSDWSNGPLRRILPHSNSAMIAGLAPPTTATLKPLGYNSTGKYPDVVNLQYSNTQMSYILILPQIEPTRDHHGRQVLMQYTHHGFFNHFPDPVGRVKMIYLHGFKIIII
jgi:hypothetical protein